MSIKSFILIFICTTLSINNAITASAEVTIGQIAPDFSLPNTDGTDMSLSDFEGQYRVLEWTNPDCPFVKKHYDSTNMQNLQDIYTKKGVIWLSINSSAEGKQGHYSKEDWRLILIDKDSMATATLLDSDGAVGHFGKWCVGVCVCMYG